MKIYALLFAAMASTASANTFSDACANKSDGDDCLFSLPDGSSIYGTCFEPDSPSACGPEYVDSSLTCIMCGDTPTGAGGGGGSGDDGNNAPKVSPSVAACTDKSLSDSCGFTTADGTKVSGSCADEGSGACGPVDTSSDTSVTCYVCSADNTGGDTDTGSGPINSDNNECADLSEDDECTVVRGTDTFTGVCQATEQAKDTSDTKLACVPVADDKVVTGPPGSDGDVDPEASTDLQDACASKSADQVCSYTDPATNKQINGICADDGSGTLQCDNQDAVSNPNGDSSDDPLVDACSGLDAGSDCEVTTSNVKITGSCTESDAGDLFCAPSLPSSPGASRNLRH